VTAGGLAPDGDYADSAWIKPLRNTAPEGALPIVLSVAQAASILGISKDLAYDLAARGELPSLRFGRRVVVPTKPLITLLNGGGLPDALRRKP
jgi:excisionase family DNA binding protein